jgi:N-acetyl-gamma-glutamyl-phosphate reductase
MNGVQPAAAASGVALFGATGYAGREAARLIATHPAFRLAAVFGGPERVGLPLAAIHPALRGLTDARCEALPENGRAGALAGDLAARGVRFALLATPEAASMRMAPPLIAAGLRVVDLSGAFRLDGPDAFADWYGADHEAPALFDHAVYGLAEWRRAAIAAADLVANPGCYPTAALLAILPLRRAGLIDSAAPVVVHAVSGVSGAGRRLREDLLFCEVEGSVRPYGLPRHRHLAEIARLADLAPGDGLIFIPHLAPFDRGLIGSVSLRLAPGAGPIEIAAAFAAAYAGAPFVRALGDGPLPSTGDVRGTNTCALGWTAVPGGRHLVVHAVIDNLIKGAAGQAVQNLNLMAGRPEDEGLPR